MSSSNVGESATIGDTQPAQNILEQEKSNLGSTTRADLGNHAEAHASALKDKVDGVDEVVPPGKKRADQNSGGRVMVAETGDLHDLAAKRHG